MTGGRTGPTVFDLGHPFARGMSTHPAVPPFLRLDVNRHGDRVIGDGVSVASDMLVTSPHAGTHIDALAHVADARGDAPARTDRPFGEALPVLLARGVLLDLEPALADAGTTSITPAMVQARLAEQQTALRADDVVLVRTGWERHWGATDGRYGNDVEHLPGLGLEAAEGIAEAGAIAIGTDTTILEPAGTGLAVHRFLLQERGIYILENLHLSAAAAAGLTEFLFLAAPLRIEGATGSPVRPIAIVGAELDLAALMVGAVPPDDGPDDESDDQLDDQEVRA